MANTKLPAAIDWLVANITTAMSAAVPGAKVYDGFPTSEENDQVVIGASPRDDGEEGDLEYIAIGNQAVDEEFDVPIAIRAHRGGNSQKGARDAAFAMFNAVVTTVRNSADMGGLLRPYTATIQSRVYVPTTDPEDAKTGREARIYFDVHCKARI